MRLFKKNIAPGAGDKAAEWITNFILRMQRKFSEVLEKKSVSWKAKQQWIFLYMICLVFGGLSVVSVITPFHTKKILVQPAAIRMPRMIPDDNSISPRITDDEIKRVHDFEESLDSTTKKKLLTQRPGLMDSLRMVEQLYYSQKK